MGFFFVLCSDIINDNKQLEKTINERNGIMNQIEEKWINLEEAANYLGVKPGTIRAWLRQGKDIPAHKIGKQWKFKCSDLDKWVKSGESAL